MLDDFPLSMHFVLGSEWLPGGGVEMEALLLAAFSNDKSGGELPLCTSSFMHVGSCGNTSWGAVLTGSKW